MYKKLNSWITKKDTTCTLFAADIFPCLHDIFFRYGNPDSEEFSVRKVNLEAKKILKEVEDYGKCEANTPYLISFETENKTSSHVGIYYNGYIYHYKENAGVVAESFEKSISEDIRYKKHVIYEVKECK